MKRDSAASCLVCCLTETHFSELFCVIEEKSSKQAADVDLVLNPEAESIHPKHAFGQGFLLLQPHKHFLDAPDWTNFDKNILNRI